MKKVTIHFISENKRESFIAAKTSCGKDWRDVDDFTSDIEFVTCKICAKSLTLPTVQKRIKK